MGRTGYTLKDKKVIGGPSADKVNEIPPFIQEYKGKNGYSPSLRDITDSLEISSVSVTQYYLNLLRRFGIVDWVDGKMRTLRVAE